MPVRPIGDSYARMLQDDFGKADVGLAQVGLPRKSTALANRPSIHERGNVAANWGSVRSWRLRKNKV